MPEPLPATFQTGQSKERSRIVAFILQVLFSSESRWSRGCHVLNIYSCSMAFLTLASGSPSRSGGQFRPSSSGRSG